MLKKVVLEPENVNYNKIVSVCKKLAGNVIICGDIVNRLNDAINITVTWDDFLLTGTVKIVYSDGNTVAVLERKGYNISNNLILEVDNIKYYLVTNSREYHKYFDTTGYKGYGIYGVEGDKVWFCAEVESLSDVKYPDTCINLLRKMFTPLLNLNVLEAEKEDFIKSLESTIDTKLENILVVLPDSIEGTVVHGYCERDNKLVFRDGIYKNKLPEHITHEEILCQFGESYQ